MTSTIKYNATNLFEFKSLCSIESPGFELSGNLIFNNDFDPSNPTTAPIPFTFDRSTAELDIDATIGGFQGSMIDISNQAPTRDLDVIVRYMGGSHIVQRLGDTFKEYIRSWREGTIDPGSDITIHTKPVITKIIVQDPSLGTNYGFDTYPAVARGGTVNNAPDNTEYYSNLAIYSTYVFKTPLVFTIVESGVTKYVIFQSDNGED